MNRIFLAQIACIGGKLNFSIRSRLVYFLCHLGEIFGIFKTLLLLRADDFYKLNIIPRFNQF